jgi:hypothetical protein
LSLDAVHASEMLVGVLLALFTPPGAVGGWTSGQALVAAVTLVVVPVFAGLTPSEYDVPHARPENV